MIRRSRLATRPNLESLEGRLVLSALTPAQLDSAYGLNSVRLSSNGTAVAGTGAGQTIAVIDVYHDPNIATELATFDAKYGLAPAQLSVDNLAGSNVDAGWSSEEALDVEWAHAAAPGAKILVVEAASPGTNDLITAINAAKINPNVSVVSMSWGTSEFRSETGYDSVFTTPAGHTGITYLASAGDSGAGAEWPASSPNVVGVGGTSLVVGASGAWASETAWAGSGGGISRYEAEPSYQKSAQSTGLRTSPDVSLDSDPNTGVSVYSIAGGGWIQVGGTSLASPVWAGLIAAADQGRAAVGKGTLDGATQTLADLYAAPSGSFDDITTGSRATVGYDTSTGLGTPNAVPLVAALAGDPNTGAAPTPTTPPTGTPAPAPAPTPAPTPRHPRGGWWGFFGVTTSPSGNTRTTVRNAPKTVAQTAPKPTYPTTTGLGSTGKVGHSPFSAGRSVDVVLQSWGRWSTL